MTPEEIRFKEWIRSGGCSRGLTHRGTPNYANIIYIIVAVSLILCVIMQRYYSIFGGEKMPASILPSETAANTTAPAGFSPGLPASGCQNTMALAEYLSGYVGAFNMTGLSVGDLLGVIMRNQAVNATVFAYTWSEFMRCGWSAELTALLNNPFISDVTLKSIIHELRKI
jgi:hypothetical protein